jgi:CheY-like chemotaxis protein
VGLKVLIVDDNATNRKVLTAQLKGWGIACEAVTSASEALESLRAAATHREQSRSGSAPFDVAFLDHQMPDCDGAELGRLINSDPDLSQTRLILLTSSGQQSDRDQFAALGFAGYLLKPVARKDLIEALSVVMGGNAEAWHTQTQPIVTSKYLRDRRGHGARRILVAEDDQVNRKVAVQLLELEGYQVDTANDGNEAVSAWRLGRYDLILMDCQMPDLDGYQATQAIRAAELPARRIPIVALTANAMPGTEARCKAAGMDAYLTKPFDRDVLSACLENLLAAGKAEPLSSIVTAEGPAANEPPTVHKTAPPPVVDFRALERLAAGDEAFELDLIDTFINISSGQLEVISRSLDDSNGPAIAQAAHKLKANSGSIFAKDLSACAARVEEAARSGVPDIASLIMELKVQLEQTIDSLNPRRAALSQRAVRS